VFACRLAEAGLAGLGLIERGQLFRCAPLWVRMGEPAWPATATLAALTTLRDTGPDAGLTGMETGQAAGKLTVNNTVAKENCATPNQKVRMETSRFTMQRAREGSK